MNFTFDFHIFLLICFLLHGLAGLRMVKVSIPAYKLRGESALLECQYELDRVQGTKHTRNRNNQYSTIDHDNSKNYNDGESAYNRISAYSYPQHQHQPHYEQRLLNGAYYSQPQKQAHTQYELDYQTQISPYGHNVNKGSMTRTHEGRIGTSIYTGGSTYLTVDEANRDDSFDDSKEDAEEEVESEALYAIKWYKDNEEFYRYVPKANPPKTSYRLDGIRVIEEHSDSSRVFLRSLTLNSTGLYRCEVSAEAPNFSSVQGESRMDIVYLPRDGPHIKGQQFQYQIGETLNLNCTSGKSHPASHLQWFINDQPVIDGRYLVRYNDTVHKHGLITSTLGLQLTVDTRHFHNGAMRVKCLASISPVLWRGGKESILQRRPAIIDNREAMFLVRSSSSGLHRCSFLGSLRIFAATEILIRLHQLLLRFKLSSMQVF